MINLDRRATGLRQKDGEETSKEEGTRWLAPGDRKVEWRLAREEDQMAQKKKGVVEVNYQEKDGVKTN
jgi:hypothetical protein